MIFTTPKEKLLHAISLVERVVGKKESLPVLSCVLLDINKELSVRATNLESGIQVTVPGDIKEKGTVAVPVGVFHQTLRSIVGDKVTFKVEGGNLLIESKGTKTLIKAIPHNEFPSIPTLESKKGVEISRYAILSALQSVVYAASPSMIRPELGSVFVSVQKSSITCVATDSFRLAEKSVQQKGGSDIDVLIPLKHVVELIHILERMPDEIVTLVIDDTQLIMQGSGVEFSSRVTDAQFPNYKDILPKKFSTEATILKSDFSEMLRKARVFSGSEQRVGLHVYPKKKVFDATAQSATIGEMSDSIDAALTGDDVDINFNIGYLSDGLSSIESDSITLGFSGPGRPLVIRGSSDQSFTYLVMPLNR